MDFDNTRYRSVSQNSLHSTYQDHERVPNTARLRSSSQPRLPFQSLQKTSALLRTPGPLDGMLKTTTETGDLDLFSFNSPTSKGTYHRSPRSRPVYRRTRRYSRPPHDGYEDDSAKGDRGSLPSYRDTTSDIVSLYGTPTAPHTRTFSPGSESQRTLSLMTCSSRRIPSFKSSGTSYSRQSSAGFQRPSSAPYYSSGAGPSRTPSETLYPSFKSPYRQHVAGDQSIRSASLSSIVEMYQGRSPAPPPRSPSSFYYDYTEEFDRQPSDGYANPSVVGSPLRETNKPLRNLLSAVHFKAPESGNKLGETTDTEYVDGNATTIVAKGQEPNQGSGTDSTLSEWAWPDTKNQQDAQKTIDETPKKDCLTTSIPREHDSAANSIDSSLSEWAWPEIQGQQDIQETSESPPEMIHPCPEKRLSQVEDDAKEQYRPKDFEGHHRRNFANAKINTDMLIKPGRVEDKENDNLAILSPNPISPARQLRVTNSIPQLMKALPPLPDEAQDSVEPLQETSFRDIRAPAHALFTRDPATTVTTIDLEHGGVAIVPLSDVLSYCNNSTKLSHDPILPSPSRFKVRLRSPGSAELRNKWSIDSSGIPERSSSNPIKPRLKLKVSRSRMGSGLLDPNGTIVRRAGLRQHSSLQELKDFPQRCVYTDRTRSGEGIEKQLAQSGADKRLPNIDEGTLRGFSQQLSDQFDISYPPSTEGIVMADLVTEPKVENKKRRRYFGKRPPVKKTANKNKWYFFVGPRVMPPRTHRVKRWATEAKRAVQSLVGTISRS
ncbi:hypothetical protein FHETE_6468 [Fusarium heterosporum]|uniref:Uncharacterized protein n=1 Tax=Fusarium heterosporum TaxID=42747 RepID=A0A8H5WN29_FUSHE|nr:hypothetical protein FHETE_6468 [Fusarium heterosporum]